MASAMKRTKLNKLATTPDQQDSFLADDSSVFDSDLTLDFKVTDNDIDNDTTESVCDSLYLTEQHEVGRVSFEVTAADKVRDGRTSYVKYTILITRYSNNDKVPTTVERRYSDFEKLNSQLKKKYPDLMDEIAFPKKLLLGNFKSETIARRSRAFEQYLAHLFSETAIRYSKEFTEFFFLSDLRLAYSRLCDGEYSAALRLLDKCIPIQVKLQGEDHCDVVASFCAMLVCYKHLDNLALAHSLSQTLLSYNVEADPHYVPLLQFAIHICWLLGKEKQDLESRLQGLQNCGVHTEAAPNLRVLVVHRFT
ncbi:hypothetical protein ScPMuIL_001967 [Solemya velum]